MHCAVDLGAWYQRPLSPLRRVYGGGESAAPPSIAPWIWGRQNGAIPGETARFRRYPAAKWLGFTRERFRAKMARESESAPRGRAGCGARVSFPLLQGGWGAPAPGSLGRPGAAPHARREERGEGHSCSPSLYRPPAHPARAPPLNPNHPPPSPPAPTCLVAGADAGLPARSVPQPLRRGAGAGSVGSWSGRWEARAIDSDETLNDGRFRICSNSGANRWPVGGAGGRAGGSG